MQIFSSTMRGYDRFQVHDLLSAADLAIASGDEIAMATAREALQSVQFGVALRGYDRKEVDHAVTELLGQLGGA